MKFYRFFATGTLLGFAALGACGAPPEVQTPVVQATATASAPIGVVTAAPTATSAPQPTAAERIAKLEAQHVEFIKSCQTALPDATAADASAFCECGWGDLRAKASEADIIDDNVPKELAESINQSNLVVCGPKLTEPSIQAMYMADCTKDGAEMKAFCECGFGVMKKEKLATLAVLADSTQMRGAFNKIGAACGASYPEKLLRTQILSGCSGSERKCKCIADLFIKKVPRAKLIVSDPDALKAVKAEKDKCN
jgi:hypothetical protein